MTAIYDFRENPNPKGDKEKQPLHPRIVSYGTVSTQRILEDISHASTFDVGELKGVMSALAERVAYYLREGYHVQFGEIGYFSASLMAIRTVHDRSEIRAPSIYFNNVNFRATRKFRKKISGFVERAKPGQGLQVSSSLSEEERKRRLLRYLETHPFITRIDYSAMTGRLKNTAQKDLNAFVKQGIIVRHGRANRVIYTLPLAGK
ncbi:MAG: DNA-binding protein [Bacteroides sp.]|nr:DNA-binding protein [Bacteroides sp.]